MIKIFIPSDFKKEVNKKRLFTLVRPFLTPQGWGNDEVILSRWNLNSSWIYYTANLAEADFLILPYSINDYVEWGELKRIRLYSTWCVQNNCRGLGFISGDWGQVFPEYSGITYFRAGGFKLQLSRANQGFPIMITDWYKRVGLNKMRAPVIRKKNVKPVVGFCGHATTSLIKSSIESVKFIFENTKRFIWNPLRKDWEQIFRSAYHRAVLLNSLEKDTGIITNFIYRDKYRAGARTQGEKKNTEEEYFQNILNSDYVLCVRGGGNFSVRLYETLMMGRIPVFVNTDCLMPFEKFIEWRRHVVWVEWVDRFKVGDLVREFHQKLTNSEFEEIQVNNRKLWETQLSVAGIFRQLMKKNEI